MVTAAAAPRYAAARRIGGRSHQCDATAVASFGGTVAHVLQDGMGCSDEIAHWTQATARQLAETAARLGDADAALRQVHAAAAAEPGRDERWRTMPRAVAVVAVFRPGVPVQIAWCGDARAYRRGLDGVVRRITDDHNDRQDALERGLPGEDRSKVLSFLGDPRPSPRFGARTEPAEGLLLLISEGGYEPLEELGCELWVHLLGPLDEVADDMAAFAAAGDPNADNATVVVIDLSPDHQPPRPGAHRA
ncbi:mucin-2 [Streptomyces sp. NPDC050523]|uniref:mucin-2 n=1 Tax=Streptomyces sp. NPDC050523 TaxID=3365622 RepID=UPI00378E26B3